MERLELRFDLAYSLAHDENHPEAAKFFSERRKDGATVVRRGCVGKLREHLRDVIGGEGGYIAHDGVNSWHFDVDENDLVGDMWTMATWDDGDCGGSEFPTPRLETFTSQETAIETFVKYVKDRYKAHCMKWPDEFISDVRKSLADDGKVQVSLGTCVSCVLYHNDAKNVKE
jgi:hypothetical protein